MGVPAAGKAVTSTGIAISRLAGGKFVEEWGSEDMLGLMQQVGASDKARLEQDDPANDKTLSPFFCSPVNK